MRKAPIFPILATITAIGILSILYMTSKIPDQDDSDSSGDGYAEYELLEKPSVVFGNPTIGPNDAKVTIIEYGDYLCVPCATLDYTLKQLADEYPNDVRLVWKDLPNDSLHPGASTAAIAARCAGHQNAFWGFHQILLSGQAGASMESYEAVASAIGLNADQFNGCLRESQSKPLVERDIEEAMRLRLDATPYVFINDRRLSGAVSYDLLKGIIESEITEALRQEAEGTESNE